MMRKIFVALSLISLIVILPGLAYLKFEVGQYRGLSGFYEWTREDPLFYSPDLGIDKFKSAEKLKIAVDNLDRDQKKLLAKVNRSAHIYPTDFLKSFIETSSLTREFLKNPTSQNAKELVKKQKQTAYLYKKEAQDLLNYLEDKMPSDFHVIMLNMRKSVSLTLLDLARLSDNGDSLSSEIERREECLKKNTSCLRPSSNFKKPTDPEITVHELSEKLQNPKLIFAPLKENFDYTNVKGPYIAKTPCFGWGKNFVYPDHFFYIFGDPDISRIQLATDIYFRKASLLIDDAPFIKAGIDYSSMTSTALYTCPYNGYLAEISEMNFFLKLYEPILSRLKFSESLKESRNLKEAKMFESALFDSRYPAYEDFSKLASYYGYVYKTIIQNKVLEKDNAGIKNELLRRKLGIENKFGDLHKLLSYADLFIKISLGFKWSQGDRDGGISVDRYLYAYRNFYGLLFLPFSPAVYRNPNGLTYFDLVNIKNAVSFDGGYITYSQALAKYSESEILKWFDKDLLRTE